MQKPISVDVLEGEAMLAAAREQNRVVASRGKPVADIEEGHISTASCILANLSMQLGRPLTYDPARRQVAGHPEATRLLTQVREFGDGFANFQRGTDGNSNGDGPPVSKGRCSEDLLS